MATVDLELNADFRKANKAVDGLKAGFKAMAAAAGALAGAFAFKKVTDAAVTQEKAVRSLNVALALTGTYSKENSKSFQDWASQLQKNSTIGDEVSLSLVGLAKSMGATDDQTKKIIETAADMSAVTGDSLEVNVEKLAKTLGGFKGRLGQTEKGIRSLTAEQLKNGEGVDRLSVKYKGAAKELKKTYGGAVEDATNSFGDLLEEIGFYITKNPLFIKATNDSSWSFARFGAIAKNNRQAVIDFTIDALGGLIKGFAFLIDTFKPTIVGLNVIADIVTDVLIASFSGWAIIAVNAADDIIKALKLVVNIGLAPLTVGLEAVAKGLNAFGVVSDKQLSSFSKALKDLNADSSTSGLEAVKDDLIAFNKEAVKGLGETVSLDGLITNFGETQSAIEKAAQETFEFADGLSELKKSSDGADKSLKKLSDTNKDFKEAVAFGERKFTFGKAEVTGAQVLEGGGAVAAGVAGGAEGLNKLFVSGVTAAANAALPGAGAIAGPIAELLAAGPESAKLQIEAFIDQIPILIDNVIAGIPVIIETLAAKADVIILALVAALPTLTEAIIIQVPIALAKTLPAALGRILQAFVDGAQRALDEIFSGLTNGIGQFWVIVKEAFMAFFIGLPKRVLSAITKAVTEGIPNIMSSLASTLGDFFKSLGQTLGQGIFSELAGLGDFIVDPIQDFFNGLSDIGNLIIEPIRDFFNQLEIPGLGSITGGGGGGGGGGLLGTVSKAFGGTFGLAEGGSVPAGFPNDTFPARLSSGENVIDQSTNEKLNAFLDSGGGQTKVVLQVGERELAEVLLNLNRQGFRTA